MSLLHTCCPADGTTLQPAGRFEHDGVTVTCYACACGAGRLHVPYLGWIDFARERQGWRVLAAPGESAAQLALHLLADLPPLVSAPRVSVERDLVRFAVVLGVVACGFGFDWKVGVGGAWLLCPLALAALVGVAPDARLLLLSYAITLPFFAVAVLAFAVGLPPGAAALDAAVGILIVGQGWVAYSRRRGPVRLADRSVRPDPSGAPVDRQPVAR